MFNPEVNTNTVDQKFYLAMLNEQKQTNELLSQLISFLRPIAKDAGTKPKKAKPKPKTPTKKGGTKLGNSNKGTVQDPEIYNPPL